jgi:very-short-patch-repair endonuclease
MPSKHSAPHPLHHRVFLVREAVNAGLVTYSQVRNDKHWRPVLRGVYADSALPFDHRVKMKGAGLLIPASAAVTGLSAACLLGVDMASGSDPVDILVPPEHRFGPVRGLRIRTGPLSDTDTAVVGGLRTTLPVLTAWELSRRLPLLDAVAAVDALMHLGRLTHRELSNVLDRRAGAYGVAAARSVFRLVDGRAESPQESRLRVRLVLAGFPRPTPQFEVLMNGQFVARVDLAWPELGVALEYDGLWHGEARQFSRDRRRLNALVAAGWTVYHVTAAHMRDWDGIVRDLSYLMASRRSAA